MYKGETLFHDGNESVGIGLPALMSQTNLMIRNSNSKKSFIRRLFTNHFPDNLERRMDNQERLETIGKDEISNQ